jgi:hypothetical protein
LAALLSVTAPRLGRRLGAVVTLAVLGSSTAAAAAPAARCDRLLTVQLTPDVPDPRNAAFVSSLLGNHPGYQLTVRQQRDGSVVVLELTGPGPGYLCQSVVDAMRKDGRVLSVRERDASPSA